MPTRRRITDAPDRQFADRPGTSGDDVMTGTARADVFDLSAGGSDRVSGLGGTDFFLFGETFDASDHVDGGRGRDYLRLAGSYPDPIVMTRDMLVDVETIVLDGVPAAPNKASYRLELVGDLFTSRADADLYVSANFDTVGSLVLDATRLTGARLQTHGMDGDDIILGAAAGNRINGNDGNDRIAGGTGDDVIEGDRGSDTLSGGGGHDVFRYTYSDSGVRTGTDTILDFGSGDRIDLEFLGQNFHLADGVDHVGAISIGYQRANDLTTVRISVDDDPAPELLIRLAGDHRGLTLADFIV